MTGSDVSVDVSFATEPLSFIFLALVGIHMTHELGHRAMANAYKLNITAPTLVPSSSTGILTAITDLKSPPKDKNQLFDFAIAGPLAGYALSLAALLTGLALTAVADNSAIAGFPNLPVGFLRQSSLGGGLIETFLGNSIIYLPEGAENMQDQLKVALHPAAIAGYYGLLVNAMSLFPFGRTDGGRILTAMGGRISASVLGNIAMAILFLSGLVSGSNLLLLYFSFFLVFQKEQEIPAKNEVEPLSPTRILVGGIVFLVAIKTVSPL